LAGPVRFALDASQGGYEPGIDAIKPDVEHVIYAGEYIVTVELVASVVIVACRVWVECAGDTID